MNKFLKIVGAVAIINIAARLFGFLREMVIGYQYGFSFAADSIFTAYMVPNFLYLVVGGAFTTAVISLYNRKTTNQAEFVKQSFTIVLTSGIVMTAILVLFADPIIKMLYENNENITPAAIELTKHLSYWMMPSSIFLILASYYSGLLNVHDKFHLSSFSILIYNVAFIVIAVALSFVMGPIGYGISALASSIIMIYFLIAGYRKLNTYPIGISFKRDMTTRDLWIMVVPVMIGGGTVQIYAMLQRFFANLLGFGESAISVVNYASRLTQFPQTILITAVTTVIYPILSRKEAEDDHESIKKLYTRGLRFLVLLMVPVSIFAYFYAENIIQVIFEYGNFTEEGTKLTTPVMQIFVLSMFFLAANTYITRFYYAKGDSLAPVIFSIINVFIVNIAVIYFLADLTGVASIAWGTLISSVVNTLLLIVYAHFKYGLKVSSGQSVKAGLQLFIPLVLIGVITYFSSKYLVFNHKWITFMVGLVIFGASTLGLFMIFKIQEVGDYIQMMKKKFFGNPKA